jgi:hypothetical protein
VIRSDWGLSISDWVRVRGSGSGPPPTRRTVNDINNRQSNRIVKNSFALAAYTDLSTQEMNDLRDLTSRFRSRARSIIWCK